MRTGTTVVVGLVVAAGLAGGGLWADARARDDLEQRVLDRAGEVLPGLVDPEVEIAGILVLPQIVRGRLDEVTATAAAVTVAGTTLTEVTVVGQDVALDPAVAGRLEVVGTVPTTELAGHLPGMLDLTVLGGEIVLETTVLDLPLRMPVTLAVSDGDALVTVRAVSLAGLEIAMADLPGFVADLVSDLRIDLPEVAGTTVTDLTVVPDGLRVTATGTAVALSGH